MRHADIVGAGLAGLAAALSLVEAGWAVTLHEAGPAAGGRCRSYFDRELGCRIDNGNHLLLSGNRAAMGFLRQVRAEGSMAGPARPLFPFMDLRTGRRWALRPNAGRVPWWLLHPGRRVPGARLRDLWAMSRLDRAPADATVAGRVRPGALYDRLLEPLAIAALNTLPDVGSARLLGAVVAETLGQGGAACRPMFPRVGLSESFIDPAVAWLGNRGAVIRTGCRVAGLRIEAGRVAALEGPDGATPVRDRVVLAVPAATASALLPGLSVPTGFEAIANLHYRHEARAHGAIAEAGFVGLVGGVAEWIFVKPGVVSVTISAANRVADRPGGVLAATVWREICRALAPPRGNPPRTGAGDGMEDALPPYRLVREKRATFAATPAQDRLRPSARTDLANLVLAGDYVRTGLPATIEGAIRSGRDAARLLEPA